MSSGCFLSKIPKSPFEAAYINSPSVECLKAACINSPSVECLKAAYINSPLDY